MRRALGLLLLAGALSGCAFAPGSSARMKAGPRWGEHAHDYQERRREREGVTGDTSISTTWPCATDGTARCP